MNKKVHFFSLMITLGFFALAGCGEKATTSAPGPQVSGYDTEAIEGSSIVRASKSSGDIVVEEGYLLDGTKTGLWVTYDADGKVTSMKNYVNGKLDGVSVVMSQREQIDEKAHYRQDVLHGLSGKYRFGRPEEELPYKNGQLDGIVRKYYQNGKIREEIGFKDGKQHGSYKYYNEDGSISLDYTYENGEKISGGIVE